MQGFFTISAKNVAGGVQQLAAADAGEVRGQRRQVGRDGLLQQLRVQAGVLSLDHHGAGNGMSAGQEVHFLYHGSDIDVGQVLALGALLDDQRRAGKQGRQGLGSAGGDAGVVLKGDIRPEIRQVADGAGRRIAVQHAETGGHTGVELFGDAAAVGVLGDLEVQELTVAGLAHGQGQDDGDDGMGVVALGVLDVQLGAGKGALEGAEQVQVGDIGGLGLLDEQDTEL